MTKGTPREGFTLIELMIVIAIIAVIAAIAIPGLLSSQRASNERSASTSLKTLATAETDFRANDRDGNKIQDFWTVDITGLYGLIPAGSTEMIKLIDISVAGADFEAETGLTMLPAAGPIVLMDLVYYCVPSPKAGYWFKALTTDEAGDPYAVQTNGVLSLTSTGPDNTNAYYNIGKFAFCAFPDGFASGRLAYFLNQNNTVFRRSCNGPVKAATQSARQGAPLSFNGTGLLGDHPAEDWPSDQTLKAQYSKID